GPPEPPQNGQLPPNSDPLPATSDPLSLQLLIEADGLPCLILSGPDFSPDSSAVFPRPRSTAGSARAASTACRGITSASPHRASSRATGSPSITPTPSRRSRAR